MYIHTYITFMYHVGVVVVISEVGSIGTKSRFTLSDYYRLNLVLSYYIPT
jgi:hypothetical protein